MIRERPGLASTIAGHTQITCDRQHVFGGGRGASSLLRVILTLYCLTMTCGSKDRLPRGIKELQKALHSSPQIVSHCDFELPCDLWFWNRTSSFRRVAASSTSVLLPPIDADNSTKGTAAGTI